MTSVDFISFFRQRKVDNKLVLNNSNKITTMKLVTGVALAYCVTAASAFGTQGGRFARPRTFVFMGIEGLDLSGNAWQPDSSKMGSTDTGDYYPEGYENDIAFTEGMKGSQAFLGGNKDGPALPGMEHLGEDAIMMGGIEEASDIPKGMEFIPSSVPDGTFEISLAASSDGQDLRIEVAPVCMTFEDFYAAFSKDSHPCFTVSPQTGRMDRRGGEKTQLTIRCEPNGRAGTHVGNLVINLPEDNSKICYKITATCF